ncbi:haloacid dehalogenase [Streptomyces sp. NPDC096142]|uniref:haloacid dehalogenase n=1 Tax=Streptomyces sp. NPDC096142 TaxID=3366077 RepID=UPI00382A44F6
MLTHTAAVFFSLDCILVRGSSLSHLVEERLGLSGTSGVHGTGETDAAHWTGILESALHTQLGRLPAFPGVAETTRWCWGNGLVPVISGLAWAPMGAHLAERFGFHSYSGRFLESANGRFTGRTDGSSAPVNHADFVLERADDLGFEPMNCAAVGACPTDGPLFDAVGLGVAFNASCGVRSLATTSVDGEDLSAVIPALERLSVIRV